MALDTFDDLKTSIANWTARDDLTALLPDFIALTEAFFVFEPRPPQDPAIGGLRVVITEETGTLTASQTYISKPADLIAPIRFDLTGTTGRTVDYVSPDAMPRLFTESTGLPKYWTVSNVIEFNIAPDSAYPYSLKYYSNPTGLSDANTSNAILTGYPNVYLSGCLHHAFQYIQDQDQSNLWLARYKAYAWAANQSFRAALFNHGSIAAQVA